jgi:hypothetical protein
VRKQRFHAVTDKERIQQKVRLDVENKYANTDLEHEKKDTENV